MFESLPVERADRWELMRTITARWMRPLTEADAVSPDRLDQAEKRLGCRLPKALREWVQLAGAAKDIWSRQDHLFTPEEQAIWDDVLVFCAENQLVWSMGVRLADCEREDPPVFGWMNTHWVGPGEFGPLNDSVSEAALQYLAWAMKWANWNPRFGCHLASDFSGSTDFGWWKPDTRTAIERHFTRCAFPVWRLMGRDNLFYEGQDLLIQMGLADEGGGDANLFVSVLTLDALANFEKIVRGTGFRWASGRWYS